MLSARDRPGKLLREFNRGGQSSGVEVIQRRQILERQLLPVQTVGLQRDFQALDQAGLFVVFCDLAISTIFRFLCAYAIAQRLAHT
jgi:hypothetical protein